MTTHFFSLFKISDPVTREYLVRLSVDTGFLDRWTADAWGVDPTLPIVAEILFTWQYLNGSRMPPKVLVSSNKQQQQQHFEKKNTNR